MAEKKEESWKRRQRRSQEKIELRRACVDKGREKRTEHRRGDGGRKRSKLAVKAAPRVPSLLPLGQALSSWRLLDDRYAVTHAAHEIPADQETADRMLAETIKALRPREPRNSTVVASGRFRGVSATGDDERPILGFLEYRDFTLHRGDYLFSGRETYLSSLSVRRFIRDRSRCRRYLKRSEWTSSHELEARQTPSVQ